MLWLRLSSCLQIDCSRNPCRAGLAPGHAGFPGYKHRRKAKSMHNAKNILIAVDASEASYRAVTYVGEIIGGRRDFRVCLLHVLPPLPQECLDDTGDAGRQQQEPQETPLGTAPSR